MTPKDVVDRLGIEAIRQKFPELTADAVKSWRRPGRGIPGRYWGGLADLAATLQSGDGITARTLVDMHSATEKAA